jgi:hypothetical protein
MTKTTTGRTASRGRAIQEPEQASMLDSHAGDAVPVPPEVAGNKAVQEGLSSSEQLVAKARALQVTNDAEYAAAADVLQNLRGAFKRIEGDRKSMTDPLRLSVERITAFFRPRVQAIEHAGNIVRQKLGEYDAEQERKREEARRKAEEEARRQREEQERKEREQREKAERERAEAERLERERREAERRRIEEQERAERLRREEEESRRRGEAEAEQRRLAEEEEQRKREAERAARNAERADAKADVAAEAAVSVVAPVVETAPAKVDGIARTKVWKWSVTDASQHNRKYLVLDEKQVDKVVKALGKDAEEIVGGISVRQEFSVSARAK